jgi:hypothetical protein
MIAVQDLGTGTLEAQLAGMFVVPVSDPLADADGSWAAGIQELGARLQERAIRHRDEGPADAAVRQGNVVPEALG